MRSANASKTKLLGVVVLRTGLGKRIAYGGENGKITSVSQANQYLRREPRKARVIWRGDDGGTACP